MALIEKKHFKKGITDQERDDLIAKDFLGKLTDYEVEVARQHGLLRWDLRKKTVNRFGVFVNAPIFAPDGKPDPSHKNKDFDIKNYADFKKFEQKNT